MTGRRSENLLAVDNTLAMIRRVWPNNDARRSVVCGNWMQLPLRDACMDLALIDGGLPAITFPDAHRDLSKQLHRVLKPGGFFIARIFARPDDTETVDEVLAALHDGRIGNFRVVKWRLAMALQGDDASKGVRVDDVWHAYDRRFGRHAELERLTGWPIDEIRTIDAYRGSPASYHFPSVGEMVDAFADALSPLGQMRGTYELAERCPILILQRTPMP
jgi:SAM-dependent methyltransferase